MPSLLESSQLKLTLMSLIPLRTIHHTPNTHTQLYKPPNPTLLMRLFRSMYLPGPQQPKPNTACFIISALLIIQIRYFFLSYSLFYKYHLFHRKGKRYNEKKRFHYNNNKKDKIFRKKCGKKWKVYMKNKQTHITKRTLKMKGNEDVLTLLDTKKIIKTV